MSKPGVVPPLWFKRGCHANHFMGILVKDTVGLGEILERNAQPCDIPAYLAYAQKRGATGISVHAPGWIGIFITGDAEAQDLATRLKNAFDWTRGGVLPHQCG